MTASRDEDQSASDTEERAAQYSEMIFWFMLIYAFTLGVGVGAAVVLGAYS